MDLFDLGEGFSSLSEGVARIQCPTLVGTGQRDTYKVLFKGVDVMSPFGAEGCRPSLVAFNN